ncbi:MAG: helix-turn-helix domain-containing protein, partial [Alistipes sp.]|nr:helix-turn-helix domain-containing protein [Alistipes sp.]
HHYNPAIDIPFQKHIIEHGVMVMSYMVASRSAKHSPIKQMQLTRQNTILHKFLSTLATDFTKSREVAYYADKLCITPKYLTIVVRNTSGMSATEWISRIVINNAKALLTGTQMTVQQISNKLNFPNPSFFGQYFLRHVGKTPKEFRRNSTNML